MKAPKVDIEIYGKGRGPFRWVAYDATSLNAATVIGSGDARTRLGLWIAMWWRALANRAGVWPR